MGNLKNRTSNPNVNSTSVLSEDFHYDLNNRLTSSQVTNGSGTQAAVTYSYDLAGDITCKSDVVNHDCSTTPTGYDYTVSPGVPGGPHAVKTAGSSAYAYDADGNMTSRAGTAITWNSDGLPLSISQDASNNSAFSYAPDKHRYKQVAMNGGIQETTIYAGGMQIISTGTTTTYEVTLSAYGRSVVMEDLTNSGTNAQGKKSVLLTDNLGSVDTVVDTTAMTSQGQSFDSFGRRRSAGSWQTGSGSGTGTSGQHGFTDHEQLDNVGLVHMNGRVYDPTVGRFLSVDPVFQAPTNGQSVNPYSYVMNNPLSLTDPSGYTAVVDNNGGSGPDTAPLQAVVHSWDQQQTSITIDFGLGGGVGGEGGRDSDGNLIHVLNMSNVDKVMTLSDGRVVAQMDNGDDYLVAATGGSGATSGNTAPSSTTQGGAAAGANASASAATGGEVAQKQPDPTQSQTSPPSTNAAPSPTAPTASTNQLDKSKFAQELDALAPPGQKSGGKCARNVREALEAGGLDTKGHPVDAGNYGSFLTKLGAVSVAGKGNLDGYKHQTGDIVVFDINDAHQSGHIAGYDGHQWVSDWRQGTFIPYRDQSHVPNYTIYRFPSPPTN